jgi:hypothetical protein
MPSELCDKNEESFKKSIKTAMVIDTFLHLYHMIT